MFNGATTFNQNIGNWDVSKVTTFKVTFKGCTSFNQDLSAWNIPEASTFTQMFKDCSSFNGDISTWLPQSDKAYYFNQRGVNFHPFFINKARLIIYFIINIDQLVRK